MNNVLVAILMWLPTGTPLSTTIQAEYIKQTFASEAECQAARSNSRFMWTTREGTKMLGKVDCTTGALPTNISIGTMNVTVDP